MQGSESLVGTFTPGSESAGELSLPGLFARWNFRSHASLLLNEHTSLTYRCSPAVITNFRDGEEASTTDG